jgi:hypothetical protein
VPGNRENSIWVPDDKIAASYRGTPQPVGMISLN